MFNGETMFHLAFKTIYWKGCVANGSERLDTNCCQVQGWKVSITKHPFEGHETSVTKTIALIWKWKAHFIRLHKFLHDFWEKYHKVHHGTCMRQNPNETYKKFFQPLNYLNMNMYMYTYIRRQEFQNIIERKLGNCFKQLFLIYQKVLNMELLNMILMVFMETLDIREIYSRFDEYRAIYRQMMNFTFYLLVCNIRFFVIRLLWRQISYKPWWLRNTGKHWSKLRYWLLRKHLR